MEDHVLVEVKPLKLHCSPLVSMKSTAAMAFCGVVGMKYLLTSAPLLREFELVALTENGLLKWSGRYKEKFAERIRLWRKSLS